MLFIHHHQTEPRERHFLLKQCVGANRNVGFSACTRRMRGFLFGSGQRTREPREFHRHIAQPMRELVEVLFSK